MIMMVVEILLLQILEVEVAQAQMIILRRVIQILIIQYQITQRHRDMIGYFPALMLCQFLWSLSTMAMMITVYCQLAIQIKCTVLILTAPSPLEK